jgi:hypothetical protein
MPDTDDTAQFMRSRSAESKTVELRGEAPQWIVAVLDGVSISENISRTAVVNRVLGAWAAAEHHKATLVLRLAGSNPIGPDSTGEGGA